MKPKAKTENEDTSPSSARGRDRLPERGRKQLKEGRVVEDVLSRSKMKTVTVQVERRVSHTRVTKYVRRFERYLVHDEKNECRTGDRVEIMHTRPLSKRKRWTVSQILEKAL